jgi:hypothetical protein
LLAEVALLTGGRSRGSGRLAATGRYGADQWPGAGADAWDLLAQMKFDEFPLVYRPPAHFAAGIYQAWTSPLDAFNTLARRGFMTPPNLKGRFGLGVDVHGFPNFSGFHPTAQVADGETTVADSPYEVNLFEDGPRTYLTARGSDGQLHVGKDALFTEAELERILRAYDVDAYQLPSRILQLTDVFSSDSRDSPQSLASSLRSVTVRSFDVPVPSLAVPRELQQRLRNDDTGMRSLGTRPNNVVDLLLARLRHQEKRTGKTLNAADHQLRKITRQLLSPDLLDNLRLNINRPFGDARDNDRDGAVDDPDEARRGLDVLRGPVRGASAMGAAAASPTEKGRAYSSHRLDVARVHDIDLAALDADETSISMQERTFAAGNARQLMARRLFVLMMLLKHAEYEFPYIDPAAGPPLDSQKMTALRLAQWSVNAVDFRDADSIMTGFEADLEPFTDNDGNLDNGTWDVEGDLSSNSPDNSQPWRAVLWGMERPDLLITETLATHDLRLIDSGSDDGTDGEPKLRDEKDDGASTDSVDEDSDLDQFRIPQGSLFVEMYCTGNPTNAVMPGDLYTYSNHQWWLDLGRHPTDPQTGEMDGNPVWRLAITNHHTDSQSVRKRFRDRPETTTFQPEQMDLVQADSHLAIDRYVWFSTLRPNGHRVAEKERVFWNLGAGGTGSVPAGQYAVVGPRETTDFGSRLDGESPREPANQEVTLGRGQIITRGTASTFTPDFDVDRDGSGNVKAAFGIIAGLRRMLPGWGATAAQSGLAEIGLNISEPLPGPDGLAYYPRPRYQLAGYPDEDAYGQGGMETPLDRPEDLKQDRPIDAFAPLLVGTHENIRTIFLQRLADPTMPWNPPPDDRTGLHDPSLVVNPYITVDWQPVDLTIFNGEARTPGDWGEDDSRFVAEAMQDVPDGVRFCTRERGLARSSQQFADNLWRVESRENLWRTFDGGDTAAFFRHTLRHSLGFLNKTYGPVLRVTTNYQDIPVPNDPTTNARALALGAPADLDSPGRRPVVPRPFPWLVWNDRPYISQYELLQVPISAPGRLTVEHSVAADDGFDPYDAGRVNNEYDPDEAVLEPPRYANSNATFGHLLNFFCTMDRRSTPGSHFYRLLEYTGVPSPFVGTETFLNPVVFQNRIAATQLRRPPFNRISKYRDPGKINLNTINGLTSGVTGGVGSYSPVYEGLFHGDPSDGGRVHPGPEWGEFYRDRRGYAAMDSRQEGKMFALNDLFPTFFAGLYGPPDAGHLVPLPRAIDATPPGLLREGVDMGLLRRDRKGLSKAPLFRDDVRSAAHSHDVDRHPYFRYQPMQRLANLTTTRSNVYAVWITVGFFETEPVPREHQSAVIASGQTPAKGQAIFDKLYPEGMWLTTEMGSDTGQTQRFRGFYILDRSIPVAYEPGRNHNVDRAVLLRRRID